MSAALSPEAAGPDGRYSLAFTVEDSGVGIAPNVIATLFDRFTQAEASTTREFGGSGLGLAICKQLVGLMGGSISVESIIGQGTRFTFDIRLMASRCEASANAKSSCPTRMPDTIFVSSNLFLQQRFRNWLAASDTPTLISNGASELRNTLSSTAKAPSKNETAVIVSWDIGSWAEISALCSDLAHLPGCSIAILAPANQAAEPEASAALNGNSFLPLPITNTAVQDFLSGGSKSMPALQQLLEPCSVSAGVYEPYPPQDVPQDHAAPSAPRLLLVEDNHVNQTVAIAMLGTLHQCRIDVANNGHAAIAKLSDRSYDLVLMDVQMPEMDGLEATRRIRCLTNKAASLPIIGMTAHAFAEDRDECLRAGMDDYISKPINRALLLEKVTHWLSGRTTAAGTEGFANQEETTAPSLQVH